MADRRDNIKLMISIVERGQEKTLLRLYRKHHIDVNFQSVGRGTASSELLDVLGFGGTERTVLLSFGPSRAVERMMKVLDDGTAETESCKGIAADMPLTGMNRIMATLIDGGVPERIEGETMERSENHSLIMIVANQGHTDEIMNTARGAGARGGTILRSRWVGPENTEQFYGIRLQEDREIVMIMASSETRGAIMETVNMKHGLKTEAGAIVCSVGIDHMVRL